MFFCVDLWLSKRGVRKHPWSDKPPGRRARTTSRWLGPVTVKPQESHSCSDPRHYLYILRRLPGQSQRGRDERWWHGFWQPPVPQPSTLGVQQLLDGAFHRSITPSRSPEVKGLPATVSSYWAASQNWLKICILGSGILNHSSSVFNLYSLTGIAQYRLRTGPHRNVNLRLLFWNM